MRSVSHDQDGEIVANLAVDNEGGPLTHEAVDHTFSIVGKTVSWLRKYLGETFKIPPEATVFVDGKQVPEDFILEQGQILEFSDEGGEEARTAELYESPEFWDMIRERRREQPIPWDEAMRQLET
jgi:hypothetical protein